MSTKDTGGPAFPRPDAIWENSFGEKTGTEGNPGMTLRDWFAGQALAGKLSHGAKIPDDTARIAYMYADAMIKERSE